MASKGPGANHIGLSFDLIDVRVVLWNITKV